MKLFGHLVLRQSSLRRGDAQRPGHLEGGRGAAAEVLNSPCNGMLTTWSAGAAKPCNAPGCNPTLNQRTS